MSDIKFLICKCCGAWHDDGSQDYCFRCLELSEEERTEYEAEKAVNSIDNIKEMRKRK